MRFSRSLGQVFLRDKRYIKKILDSLDIEKEVVLEIGPGRGEITGLLSQKAKFLYAVEVDSRLCNFLREKFSRNQKIEIIHKDILNFSLSHIGDELIVLGNVPYQISNRLIRYLVAHRSRIKRAYLTFQKEFGEKLTAKVSTKPYCFLTCFIQYYAKVQKLFCIPPEAFLPQPKVDSSFMKIEFYPHSPYSVEDADYFFKLIRQAFSQRRKKIINSLPLSGDKHKFLSSLKIDPNLRAKNLTLEDYVSLVNSGRSYII